MQQMELERQGVLLEKTIRAKTEPSWGDNQAMAAEEAKNTDAEVIENSNADDLPADDNKMRNAQVPDKENADVSHDDEASMTNSGPSSIEVEDMILQLFELVNFKNELFRRQTELMYL